jgi:hypothetical protein
MMSVLISVLAALRGLIRSRAALHFEVLALRHQLQVLHRSRPQRLRLARADRWLWAWLSRAWGDWRTAVVIVKPETVIAWHRQGFRLFWTWKSRRRHGRPPVGADARALILTMSEHNPLWGAPRIHGELVKLGIDVSQATVAKYMARRRRPPSTPSRCHGARRNRQSAVSSGPSRRVPSRCGGRPIRTETDRHSKDCPSRDPGRSAMTDPRSLASAGIDPPAWQNRDTNKKCSRIWNSPCTASDFWQQAPPSHQRAHVRPSARVLGSPPHSSAVVATTWQRASPSCS